MIQRIETLTAADSASGSNVSYDPVTIPRGVYVVNLPGLHTDKNPAQIFLDYQSPGSAWFCSEYFGLTLPLSINGVECYLSCQSYERKVKGKDIPLDFKGSSFRMKGGGLGLVRGHSIPGAPATGNARFKVWGAIDATLSELETREDLERIAATVDLENKIESSISAQEELEKNLSECKEELIRLKSELRRVNSETRRLLVDENPRNRRKDYQK